MREVTSMGIQFGCWTFSSIAPSPRWLEKMCAALSGDGSQPSSAFSSRGLTLVYRGLTPIGIGQSKKNPSDSAILWDGRLDNGQDLARELGGKLNPQSSDAEIAAAAYERWQTGSFRKMIGDWALTAWNLAETSLILAKDPIGLRPLFYALTPHELKWSSAVDLLVRDGDSAQALNFEYLAGWLSFFPAAHLTPYAAIHAVPPSSFVRFEPDRAIVQKYWDFDSTKRIEFRSDFEFEEHFRAVFANAVRRRLRSSKPLLAELSGGMDSTSIVCVADSLIEYEPGLSTKLDTLSYYDDSEPDWNERPYFTKVEEKRGRAGFHIPIDSSDDLSALVDHTGFAAIPAECGKSSTRNQQTEDLVKSGDYAAVLSGTGGDEFTGGVPTAIPELADLLVRLQVDDFFRQSKSWALSQRRPWIHVLLETSRSFAPRSWVVVAPLGRPAAWLMPQFRRRHRAALNGYDRRLQFFGARPSFQENLSTLEAVRRQIASSNVSSSATYEKRYPYLDRDLLESLFAIPRRQLIQPGRRRSLMRRSLMGIVPDEILTRKRKAYVNRAPRVAIAARWADVISLTHNMVGESLGIMSSTVFLKALQDVRLGKEVPIIPVYRTLVLERWLRNLVKHGILSSPTGCKYSHRFASASRSLLPDVH